MPPFDWLTLENVQVALFFAPSECLVVAHRREATRFIFQTKNSTQSQLLPIPSISNPPRWWSIKTRSTCFLSNACISLRNKMDRISTTSQMMMFSQKVRRTVSGMIACLISFRVIWSRRPSQSRGKARDDPSHTAITDENEQTLTKKHRYPSLLFG